METENENTQLLQYSPEVISLLQQELEFAAENGNPSDYDVRIDGRIVIPRTNNPASFLRIEGFINQTTYRIILTRYLHSNSRRNTKTILEVRPQTKASEPPTENDIEQIVKQRMEKVELQWEIIRLKEKIIGYEKQSGEREEYINGLEKEIDELEKRLDELSTGQTKSDRLTVFGLDVGDVLGKGLAGFLERNPSVLDSVGLSGIADAIKGNKPKQTPATGTSVDIQPAASDEDYTDFTEEIQQSAAPDGEPLITVAQAEYDMMMGVMKTLLSMNEYKKQFLQLMQKCAANNALIPVLVNVAEGVNTRSNRQDK